MTKIISVVPGLGDFMHKMISIVAALLVTGSLAVAQNSRGSARRADDARTHSADRQQRSSIDQAVEESQNSRLTGCLQRSGGAYWLNDRDGGRFRVTGDTDQLSQYVGHEVSIAGTEEGRNERAAQTVRITGAHDVETIASTCSMRRPRAQRSRTDRSESGARRSGIAEPAGRTDDAYQRQPEKGAVENNLPNPPLNHPRPEDETPSAGTAAHHRGERSATHSNSSDHKKSSRKRHAAAPPQY